jgi:DNA polymerase III subunit epsilon
MQLNRESLWVLIILFIDMTTSLGSSRTLNQGPSSFIGKRTNSVIRVASKNTNLTTGIALKTLKPSKFLPPIPPAPPTVEELAKKAISKPPKLPKQSKTALSLSSEQTIILPTLPALPQKQPLTEVKLDEIPPFISTIPLDKFHRHTKRLSEEKALSVENFSLPPSKKLPQFKALVPLPVQQESTETKTGFDSSTLGKLPLLFYPMSEFNKMFGEYIVIDIEATGLGNDHEMTEVAAVKMSNLQPTGEKFQMYLNPGREVSASAHKLTHYTWQKLKKFPSFNDVAHKFLRFIGDLPLIFHNAHYDLKLLNKGLTGITTYKLQDKHVIIDSYVFARKVYPKLKNGLTSLAERYGLKRPGNSDTHGALIDADLLCEVFRGLFRANGSQFDNDIDWNHLPHASVDSFLSIKGTHGEVFFRQLGIKSNIPDAFRYVHNLYHPKLHRNFPAIFIPFDSSDKHESGVYVRYFIDKSSRVFSSSKSIDQITRSYYGDDTSFPTAHIYGKDTGLDSVLVLGSISASLLFRDHLETDSETSQYVKKFLGPHIIVKALLDPGFLHNIVLSETTKSIVILSEEDPLGHETHKAAYYEMVNKLCSPQFLPLSKVKKTYSSYVGWLVRYNNDNWNVVEEERDGEEITLFMIDSKYNKRKAKVVVVANKIFIDESISIPDSHADFLLSPPRKSLVVVPLRCTGDGHVPLTHMVKKNPAHILERLKLRLPIYQPKDLAFYEKVVLARSLYDKALPITKETPSAKYFKNRGLTTLVPECLRYLPKMFHPGQDAEFPLTLVPLSDAEGRMVAVHRLYCDENGAQLPKKSGYPSKLSLGKAAGAAVELYRRSVEGKEPDTLMVSEGVENALVAREVLMNFLDHSPKDLDRFLHIVGAHSGVAVRAVVGINGLMDAPIENGIKTIIILADNDGENTDVKSTIRKTVEHYLLMGKSVKISMPTHPKHKKPDLNDVYLLESLETRDEAVLQIIKQAVKISTAEQLGPDEEPLELSLNKLLSLPAQLTKPMATISLIEQQLMDLISDRIFIERDGSVAKR